MKNVTKNFVDKVEKELRRTPSSTETSIQINDFKKEVKNETPFWGSSEIKHIAKYYDIQLSDKEAD